MTPHDTAKQTSSHGRGFGLGLALRCEIGAGRGVVADVNRKLSHLRGIILHNLATKHFHASLEQRDLCGLKMRAELTRADLRRRLVLFSFVHVATALFNVT